MKRKDAWKTYLFWILLTEAVGLISGLLIRERVQLYARTIQKPPLSPPGILFPIVWTILYALMGIAIARVMRSRPGEARERGWLLYLLQLAFNFCWSIFFFNFQAFGFALLWLVVLWLLILWLMRTFRQVDTAAARLLLPYFLWVTFAGYLNLGVWLLNR